MEICNPLLGPAVWTTLAMVDWAHAERLYREGELSIREIARREGVSEGAVRKRAKAQGWKRDSATPVRTSPEGTGTHQPRRDRRR